MAGENLLAGAASPIAAGVIFMAPDNNVLLLLRSQLEPNYGGHWALPGGKGEEGESPLEAALREVSEEIGDGTEHAWVGEPTLVDEKSTPNGMVFSTFIQPTRYKFVPELNSEHAGYAWAPLTSLPGPLHPAVEATLTKMMATRPAGAQDRIALDKATVRRIDEDGHLFVEMTPISKANVCPYYGREIPDFAALGLDANKTYRLYRDPEELAKAAPSFEGKPLMIIHIAVNAEDHPREDVVGAIGNGVNFQAPYLMAPLSVWDGDAIGLIDSGEQKELSSAYRYRADMRSGISPTGESYDGVMRDISGNHVALVKEGRAGPDVVVGDSKPNQEIFMSKTARLLSRKAIATQGALSVYLRPKLAQDAKIDLAPVLAGITAKNFGAKRSDIASMLAKVTSGKLAQDADLEDLVELLDVLEGVDAQDSMEPSSGGPSFAGKPRGDKKARDAAQEFLKGKLSAEDLKACDALFDDEEDKKDKANDADPDERDGDDDDDKAIDEAETDKDKDKDKVSKEAMDAAIREGVKVAQDEMRTQMRQEHRDLREAEELSTRYVGKMAVAYDSAAELYKATLTTLGVDVTDVPASAYKAVLKAIPVPGTGGAKPVVAMDAAGVDSFFAQFPEAKANPVQML